MVKNLHVCKTCGEKASGPDLKSVAAALIRHQADKHSRKAKK